MSRAYVVTPELAVSLMELLEADFSPAGRRLHNKLQRVVAEGSYIELEEQEAEYVDRLMREVSDEFTPMIYEEDAYNRKDRREKDKCLTDYAYLIRHDFLPTDDGYGCLEKARRLVGRDEANVRNAIGSGTEMSELQEYGGDWSLKRLKD